MKTLGLYLLQMIVASGILYGYYHLFLRNKKFHQYNRYYLLSATVIAMIIPFLQIPVYFSESEEASSSILKTLKTIYYSEGDAVVVTAVRNSFNWNFILYIIYSIISTILFTKIFLSVLKINRIIRTNKAEKLGGIHFLNTSEPGTPFSFFRWLFWNKNIELQSEKGQQIFRHEVFHIQQKHSWDVLFIEVINMIFWVNPFFHIIKKEIRAIHEFLADEFATKEKDKWEYAELLLMQALHTNQKLVTPFFHNQIKRRIAMITNSQKPSYRYLRKILVLPLITLAVFLISFTYKNRKSLSPNALKEPITVVIDAGHGGIDPGAWSADKKYSESQLNLDIAKAIKEMADEYNINVVLTRKYDDLPGNAANKEDGLRKRLAIIKEAKAELFISIHVNTTSPKSQIYHSGFEAYISSKKTDTKSELLASSILLSLNQLYKTNNEIRKSQDNGIFVLDQSICPSVLLECGYISNTSDLAFISDKVNQEKIARSILDAIVAYKQSVPNQITSPNDTKYLITDTTIPNLIEKIISKEIRKDTVKESGTQIRLRGFSLRTDTAVSPLIIVDGIVQKDDNLQNLDPNTIESMTVLKDASAMALYGKEGKNGVIIITTKNAVPAKTQEVQLEYYNGNNQVLTKDGFIIKDSIGKYYGGATKIYTSPSGQKIYSHQIEPATIIFDKVEQEASFKGGATAWRKYLERNLDPTVPAQNNAPPGTYTVFVQFLVKTDGSISDVRALTNHGYGMEEEAIKMIKKGPHWIPAIQNGHAVNAYRKQPITFLVPGDDKTSKISSSQLNEVVVVGYGSSKSLYETLPDNAIPPAFIGGEKEWRKHLERNINANVPIDNGAPPGTYTTYTQFLVKADGSVTEFKSLTNQGYGMEQEALRVIQSAKQWEPAVVNGQKVDAYKKQPVTFQVTDEGSTLEEKTNTELYKFPSGGKLFTRLKSYDPPTIYPNPSNNLITIPFDSKNTGKGEARISDVNGVIRKVVSINFIKGMNNFNVNVSDLADGTYVIQLVNQDKAVGMYKLVKQ